MKVASQVITRHKNPIDEAFLVWMNNYPESFHPCVMKRFYIFVKKKFRYARNNKWESFDYLEKSILEIKPRSNIQNIKTFYASM